MTQSHSFPVVLVEIVMLKCVKVINDAFGCSVSLDDLQWVGAGRSRVV
jgi:hypothetical protein